MSVLTISPSGAVLTLFSGQNPLAGGWLKVFFVPTPSRFVCD
jgi:hypothetical protein